MVLFLCRWAASAATIDLFEYGFNVNGSVYGSGSSLPSNVNASMFDFGAGLGTVKVTVTDPSFKYCGLYLDLEIDQTLNTFFNEYGAPHNVPAAGQSWEIDEPGYNWPYGDIYQNFENGKLDNENGVTAQAPNDVAMALGWDLALNSSQTATIDYTVSLQAPPSGFYLEQTDPDSSAAVYFWTRLDVSATRNNAPETGATFSLLVGSLMLMGGFRWKLRGDELKAG